MAASKPSGRNKTALPAIFGTGAPSIINRLDRANRAFAGRYTGMSERRQPVHTVYGGAHLFTAGTAAKIRDHAINAMTSWAPDARVFADIFEMDHVLAEKVHGRVIAKLKAEAVEDFRIDFEDGYGNRPDSEEDGHAVSAARELATGMRTGTLPPFVGFRIKPFNLENRTRSIRTLGLFLTELLDASGNRLPDNFVITLPKITVPEHSRTMAELLAAVEKKRKLKPRSLRFEIMVECPQVIIDHTGRSAIRSILDAADGRCTGAHLGAYDYTSSCELVASAQALDSPACDFARHVLQVSLAGTPVHISDGATNVMPVPVHREKTASALTREQQTQNARAVHAAWMLSYRNIRHALSCGYYQGWDLHPAQIPVRYAAMHAFFMESLDQVSQRLQGFINKAAQATLHGSVFDDAATAQGLLNFFLRGLNCGAITQAEATATGLTLEEIQTRSFLRILQGRGLV
ncbi:MAG: hypothetical protein RIQ81_2657 [Pseudomonadota bacterium]|jgi:citrate lyase beta subunit